MQSYTYCKILVSTTLHIAPIVFVSSTTLQATCCPGGLHCCPDQYQCNATTHTCSPTVTMDTTVHHLHGRDHVVTNHIAMEQQQRKPVTPLRAELHPVHFWRGSKKRTGEVVPNVDLEGAIMCPDHTHQCASDNTCCPMDAANRSWGCCPYATVRI